MEHVIPEPGQLVEVRRRHFVVTDVVRSLLGPDIFNPDADDPQHLVSLSSVEEDAHGDELEVVW